MFIWDKNIFYGDSRRSKILFLWKEEKNERTKNSPSALKLDRSNSWFYVRHPIYITHKEGNFVATSKPSALLQRISRLPTQVVSRWRVNNLLNPISSHFARWRGKINLISPKYLSWREKKRERKKSQEIRYGLVNLVRNVIFSANIYELFLPFHWIFCHKHVPVLVL